MSGVVGASDTFGEMFSGSNGGAAANRRQPEADRVPARVAPAGVLHVDAVLRDSEQLLASMLGSSARVDCHIAPGLPPIPGDRAQLLGALVNLAANAREAMPDGGQLRVIAVRMHLDRRRAAQLGMRAGGAVRVRVADNSRGLSQTTRLRAFERAYTTRSNRAGLGLWKVRQLVESWGGAIEIDSALGGGTQVDLYLPCAVHRTRERAGLARFTSENDARGLSNVP